MRTTIILLCGMLACTLLISGCGNKGDLYKADTSSGETYKPE